METLITTLTKIRVSSTLDKSVNKTFLCDGSPETCWTSSQGHPQFVHLVFEEPVLPQILAITFQGGFVGIRTTISCLLTPAKEWLELDRIFPEDVNRKQEFPLSISSVLSQGQLVQELKIVFEASSDFFGRITIYDLWLGGSKP